MKLNLNAKEFLALYNLLHASNCNDGEFKKGDDQDAVHLQQVHNRLRACMISALTGKETDPVEAWAMREQAKIDALREQNVDIKKETANIVREGHEKFLELEADDEAFLDELNAIAYPRKDVPRGTQRTKRIHKE